MRPFVSSFFAAALLCLPVLSHAGAEEDALKALDETSAKVKAMSSISSVNQQNYQSVEGDIKTLKPFFDNVAAALQKVPISSSSRLLELGVSVEAKVGDADKHVSTMDISAFLVDCGDLQGYLSQWQVALPDVRNALQQRVDAKTQDAVREQVALAFPTPMPTPAGSGPSAISSPPTATPFVFNPTPVPTPTYVPGMMATPVPASVANGGVLPGGWVAPSNPPPAFTPIPGVTQQPTPRPALQSPVAIAVGHNGQRLWVANVRGSSVGVMEAGSQRFSAQIPVGAQPQALAVDDSDTSVVVANYASNNVSILDAHKDIVLKTQAVGAGPIQVLITHAQKAYVLCQEGKTVAVIDLKLHLLLRSITLSSRPARMDMASSNQQIYVTLPDEDSVAVIDTGYDDVAATVKE
jgi:hypothetical protein